MALTTDTYWEVNGVPLQTFAYNITTWGGDLQAPPPLRGEDLTIPYRPGEVMQKRRPRGRSLTFSMWLLGADLDGNLPVGSSRDYFRNQYARIRSVLWNQGKPVTITKRWKDEFGVLQTATATGVFANGLAPIMTGNSRANFSVEFYLPDPFFYGTEKTINFPASATASVPVTIEGDYETTEIIIDFSGARNNIRLTNNGYGAYVNVSQNLATGQTIRLDVDGWTAVKNPGVSEANVIGAVTNFGHEFWMVLAPGAQTLVLSSSSGSGSATLKYKPRYI